MNFREKLIQLWEGSGEEVVWQPRLEYWYQANRNRGTLPDKYEDKSLVEIYDDLGASVRYYGPYQGGSGFSGFLDFQYTNVEIEESASWRNSDRKGSVSVENVNENTAGLKSIKRTYKTPVGKLTEKQKVSKWGETSHIVDYPISEIDDIEIMKYILEDREVQFDDDFYREAETNLGKRGLVQFYFPRSPLARLFIEYMGLEKAVVELKRNRKKIESLMEFIDRQNDEIFEELVNCPAQVLNFGENIDQNLFPPNLFRKYLVPYYEKRLKQLKNAGKKCHLHVDGSFKDLIPLLKKLDFDGFEALTPKPQGDVSLEEMKETVGDKILLDGIPAILFLDNYPEERLFELTSRVLEIFSPRLILGVSDELPPDADIDRVKIIGEMVAEFNSDNRLPAT
ncbi:hypothetical protein K9M78_05060 [Candidatus Bipolaricaulota bacterium]|nr:hypothetical protein [Candidatus Bipolaricaulota bacterium]